MINQSAVYNITTHQSDSLSIINWPSGNQIVFFFNINLQAENLRKKATRVEDENESLMMQLKKMATKARCMLIERW